MDLTEMMIFLVWIGGANAADKHGWGIFKAIVWPFYAGKALFAHFPQDDPKERQ